MAKLSDLNPNENLKLLVYGESGAGKTVFATSFPGPILVHDFDGKVASAAGYWGKYNPEQVSQIDYISYAEGNTQERYERFRLWFNDHQKLAKDGKFPYKTIVLDSLTTWSELLMKEILRQTVNKIKGPIAGRDDIPGMQHYGLNSVFFKEQLGNFLKFPCNVVVTAHIDITKDETTGEILRRPLVSGKLASYLPIIFGEVYRAYVDQKENKSVHLAQTKSDSKYNCRSQLPGLPAIVELTYKSLVKG